MKEVEESSYIFMGQTRPKTSKLQFIRHQVLPSLTFAADLNLWKNEYMLKGCLKIQFEIMVLCTPINNEPRYHFQISNRKSFWCNFANEPRSNYFQLCHLHFISKSLNRKIITNENSRSWSEYSLRMNIHLNKFVIHVRFKVILSCIHKNVQK